MTAARNLMLARVVTLAALAVAGRFLLLFLPGVSLSFFVVFIAGVGYGVRVGASVGALSRLVGDIAVSGLNPVFLAMVPVEALLGAAYGLLGRVANVGQRPGCDRWSAAAWASSAGLVGTVLWSVAADTANWLLFVYVIPSAQEVAATAWVVYVVAGIAFNVPSFAFNAVLFAVASSPVLRALRLNGLLPYDTEG